MKKINVESLAVVRERERERESYTLLKNKNSSEHKCQDNISKKMGIKPGKIRLLLLSYLRLNS